MDNRKQELHCHGCNRYVQFEIDLELNGNHVLNCPNCGHEHCRVVKDGVITGDRWDSRNPQLYSITSATHTLVSFDATTTSGDYFLHGSWINCTATS